MNRKQFEEFAKEYLATVAKTLEKKGHDYADDSDPYANLSLSEHIGVCSTEVAIFSRLLDKVSRLGNYLKKGELKNESVKDGILDLIGYSLLLAAKLEERS